MNLTNSTVQGLSGGIGNPAVIPGAIGMISSVPLVTLDGVAGFGLVERPVPKLYEWRYHVRRSHCSGFTGRMHSRVGPGRRS
jgi:hypothetical protein